MASFQPHPPTVVLFQDKCLSHRYIRSADASLVFERPQRLRAVKIGVSAAISRLRQCTQDEPELQTTRPPLHKKHDDDGLLVAMEHLQISSSPPPSSSSLSFNLLRTHLSDATVDVLNHPAVKYVHGDINGDVYLEKLVNLVNESENAIARGESEIPESLSQGDLYLCKESLDAIQGAIGAVCEAVDMVIAPEIGPSRAFVAIRPPGHHCGEDTPSGFCFVNNVVIAAAHSYLKHNVSKIVILDIDLHHGNGTQSLVWQINDETYRNQQTESDTSESAENPQPEKKKGLQIYYGSIHDPSSYPCEDGNITMVQAASVSIHGPHGQHIENVHMSTYTSEDDFWNRLYDGYGRLLRKAEEFLKKDLESESEDQEALIFISAGFDGSEHETPSMQRHGCKMPTGFFRRFTKDARTLADKYTKSRMISVLEGGYSDRALISGAMAHVVGLVEEEGYDIDENWWSVENLVKLEKSTKKRRGGGRSSAVSSESWIDETLSTLATIDTTQSPPPTPKVIPPSTMTLRDRRNKKNVVPAEQPPSTSSKPDFESKSSAGKSRKEERETSSYISSSSSEPTTANAGNSGKLPRVLLRVNPPHTDQ